MSVMNRETVNLVMNEAMDLQCKVCNIEAARDMLRKADDSPEVQLCILTLERVLADLEKESNEMFGRYVGEGVKE